MLPTEKTTRSEVVTLPGEVEGLVAAAGRQMARPLADFLKGEGINVQVVGNADSAFEEALLHRPNVVLIDERIPPAGGIELCQRLKGNTRTHFVPTILFTEGDARPQRIRALAAGADAIFVPSTDEQERRTRLWALLRTQSIWRRQEKRARSTSSAVQERRRWFGGFVHDLQSSLAAVQANFEYVARATRSRGQAPSAELTECLRDNETLLRQLSRGLRNALSVDRFAAGLVSLKAEPLLLGDCARDAAADLEWQANVTGRSIDLDRRPGERYVRGDVEHLKEAIACLLGFVLRQPANRRAIIGVWSAGGVTRLSVGGDVEGIAPAEWPRIFEPYAGPAAKHSPGAQGLGLALAKAVVDLHGGSLWVEEGLGEAKAASTFVLELKCEPATSTHRTVE